MFAGLEIGRLIEQILLFAITIAGSGGMLELLPPRSVRAQTRHHKGEIPIADCDILTLNLWNLMDHLSLFAKAILLPPEVRD